MHLRNFTFLFFLALITSGCAKVTSVRHIEGYNNSMIAHKQIVVVPPQIEIYTLSITNCKERMHDYEDHLEELIRRELPIALQENGFRVKLLHRRDVRDQKLDDLIARFRASYTSSYKSLYMPLLWEEKKAFSITQNLGESAISLGERTDSDIFLVLDYAQVIKTNGARARDFVMSVVFNNSSITENADNSVISIGIVDARSGNLLWTNMTGTSQDLYSSALDNFSARDKVEVKNLHWLINTLLSPLKIKGEY